MPYIPFTESQKQQAAAVDLAAFLRSRGEELLPSGRELRLASDHSVTVRGSEWYDHSAQRGGGPVSFVRQRYGLSYPEAMQLLLGNGAAPYPAAKQEQAPPKPFALPPVHTDMRRVYAYLIKQRGIDRQVINAFAKAGLLYEDTDHHNCVFVGKDENGIACHAHMRGTNSSGKIFRLNVEGGDPRCSFHHIGTDGDLYVFEAPIDLLSYISLHPDGWQRHSYVACCGVSFQPVQWMAEQLSTPKTVFLCMDNDNAGHKACKRMAASLAEQDIPAQRLLSQGKDWNDDLVALRQQQNLQTASLVNRPVNDSPMQIQTAAPTAPASPTTVPSNLPSLPNPSRDESEVITPCQTFGF